MKKSKYILLLRLICSVLLLISASLVVANDETEAYKKDALSLQPLDQKAWASSAKGLKYSTKPKAKKKEKIASSSNTPTPINPPEPPAITFQQFAQGMLIFLAVLILAYVIFKAIAGDAILTGKKVRRKKKISLEDIETNLQEADVESFLQKALKEGDYRLAVRLYYLAIIKELSLNNIINWKKDKTNGHYMRELRRKKYPKLEEFRNATRIFEYVWYSDAPFDGAKFKEVRADFKNLLVAIK